MSESRESNQHNEAPRLARIQLLDANGRPIRTVDLTTGGLQIGRLPGSGLVLEAATVSRNHLHIDWDGQNATVTDLGSRAGTQLGAVRLTPQVTQTWDPSTLIQIGPYTLRLQIGDDAAAPAPPPIEPAAPARAAVTPANIEAALVTGEYLTLTPGQPARAEVALANHGDSYETLELVVEGVPSEWVHTTGPIVLAPQASEHVSIAIDVPAEPMSLAGLYSIVVQVQSRERGGDLASLLGQWEVLPFASGQLEITPKRAADRSQAIYTVQLLNAGNAPARYTLSASDTQMALTYSLGQTQVSVDPGEMVEVPLTVQAPMRTFGAQRGHTFTVQAIGGGGDAPFDTAGFAHRTLMPGWAPLLLVPILLLLGLFAAQLFGRGGQSVAAGPDLRATVQAEATSNAGVRYENETRVAVELNSTASAIALLPAATRAAAEAALAQAVQQTQAALQQAQQAADVSVQQTQAAIQDQPPGTSPPAPTQPAASATPVPTQPALPTPTRTPVPPTPTRGGPPTSTPLPTSTPDPNFTQTPTITRTPTNTPTVTNTPTSTPTNTSTPVPLALSDVNPPTGAAAGDQLVTITGSGLLGAVNVTFGGAASPSVACNPAGTSCTVRTPPGAGQVPVVASIGSRTSGSVTFNYIPSITGISPNSGNVTGGQAVTINGNGFETGMTLTIGGVAATNVVCSNRTTCTAQTGAILVAGTEDVQVTVDGQIGLLNNGYSYNPMVTGVVPATGLSTGGDSVQINGAGFSTTPGQTVIRFGTNPATGVTCSSNTICTVTSPAGAAGNVSVSAIVGGRTSTIVGSYTYIAPTPTNTPTNTSTSTPTNTPTNTPTSTPTSTATNTPTSTSTSTPTSTPTDTPTSTATNTPTVTPTP